MGWGEPKMPGAGTTKQIEEAHKALDALGIKAGALAVRAIEAAEIIDRYDKAAGIKISAGVKSKNAT